MEPSQYSWDSRHSGENLLNSPNQDATSPVLTGPRKPSPSPAQMLGATTSHRALASPNRRPSAGLRRSGFYPAEQETNPVDDEDAKMVLSSMPWARGSASQWEEAAVSPSGETPLLDKGKATGSPALSPTVDDNMFAPQPSPSPKDNDLDDARLAVQFAENMPKQSSSPGNKVMTPSQFEHYRQQQELRRTNSDATRSEDGSEQEDFDDEEDELEKQRAAERQRRKQEAHLSLYRQQMQKVTGQPNPSPLLRPGTATASNSVPNLPIRSSNPGEKSSSGKSSNEEEDEEVPLGILAAHGFPNRNRPPTRLANASSHPNLRAAMHPFGSSSTSLAAADAGHRGSLPVFARNLPQDPYFGSRIVNPPNRESLALGGGASSVYGGPPSPAPPPGGLVGVIAHEERSRAARRAGGGSPNPMAMYEQMQMGMNSPHGVPRPYTMMGQPAPMTPSEQASVNLSHQMQNMVQMQMQWMGQMMQMQGMQGMPGMAAAPPMMSGAMPPAMMMGGMPGQGGQMGPPPMMPGRPMSGSPSTMGMNMNNGYLRPMSMQSQGGAMPPVGYDQQRTMSMVDPNIAARRGSPLPNLPSGPPFRPSTAGYAPSIAPSERSNAGLASRYRPVSVMAGEPGPGLAPPNQAWNHEHRHHSPAPSIQHPQNKLPKSSSLATVTVRPVSRTSQTPPGRKPAGQDDDDDDEGWAEMMKKREKKKSGWKVKRGASSLGDLLSAVH